jgi:hypothetical protein
MLYLMHQAQEFVHGRLQLKKLKQLKKAHKSTS